MNPLRESVLGPDYDVDVDQIFYKMAAKLNKSLRSNWELDDRDHSGEVINIGDLVLSAKQDGWLGRKQKNEKWAAPTGGLRVCVIVDNSYTDGSYTVRDPEEAFKYGLDPNDPNCHDQTISCHEGIIKVDKKLLNYLLK